MSLTNVSIMHVVMKYNKQYNLYFGCIVVVFLCTQNHGAIPEHVLNIDIEILRFVRKDACFVVIIIAKLTYIKKYGYNKYAATANFFSCPAKILYSPMENCV